MLEEYEIDSEAAQEALNGRSVDYGFEFDRAASIAMERAESQCESCEIGHKECREKYGSPLNRHHIKPVSTFENSREAHTPENIKILCPRCHVNQEWGAHTTDHEPESELEKTVISRVREATDPILPLELIGDLDGADSKVRAAISRMVAGGHITVTPDAKLTV